MWCLTKFTFIDNCDQAHFTSVFVPGEAQIMPTRGSFVGFLPLVSPKSAPPGAVLWGFCPWSARKNAHQSHFYRVFVPGESKTLPENPPTKYYFAGYRYFFALVWVLSGIKIYFPGNTIPLRNLPSAFMVSSFGNRTALMALLSYQASILLSRVSLKTPSPRKGLTFIYPTPREVRL